MTKIPITVIVPVKNEELNLGKCLNQLKLYNQIIVIDSSSTDRTPDIAKQYDVDFVNFEWNGKFPKKRNWALQNLSIQNEWVFFLDADEYLTDEFNQELAIKINNPDVNGFWVSYQNYFMGRRLKYGDTMKKLPIFRKNKGLYEKIEENAWSQLDMEIHEHPIVEGKTEQIKTSIIHNDFKGLEHYISRHNNYSSWEAARYLQLKANNNSNLNSRQRLKYNLIKFGLLPPAYFIGSYFLKFGFLDGFPGYYLSRYKANYFFQIQTKIKELERTQNLKG